MKARSIVLLVVVAGLAVGGCTHFQQTLTGEEQTYAATRQQEVQVYFAAETPAKQYKEIGTIVAAKDDPADAVEFVKEKAAKMGADALLNCEVRVHTQVLLLIIIPIPVHTYIASGVAVKYTNS